MEKTILVDGGYPEASYQRDLELYRKLLTVRHAVDRMAQRLGGIDYRNEVEVRILFQMYREECKREGRLF